MLEINKSYQLSSDSLKETLMVLYQKSPVVNCLLQEIFGWHRTKKMASTYFLILCWARMYIIYVTFME